MEEDETILEPVEALQNEFRLEVKDKAREYFHAALEKSEVSVEENKKETKEYESVKQRLNIESYQLERTRAMRILMVVLITLGAISLVTGFILILATKMLALPITLMVIGGVLIVVCSLMYSYPLKIKFYSLSQHVSQTQDSEKRLFASLHRKMNKITKQFDYDLAPRFISEAMPMFKFDAAFTYETMKLLDQKYGVLYNTDIDSSFKYLLTGTLNENPFLFNKNISTYMGEMVYTGSITIHWTETETDSDGNTHTEYHSEVLTASVTRPYPYYNDEISLVYFSDAAPHLVFSRDVDRASGKKREERRLQRKSTEATKSGDSFTPLSNTEFETKFHAWNRNNEVEFRLLFTPLAQENILKFINNEPDHASYQFIKNRKMNIVIDSAIQDFDLFMEDSLWDKAYSVDYLETDFVSYIDSYLKAFYYSFIPILSIPLYQQHHSEKYTEIEREYPNYSPLKYEELVNSLPVTLLRPQRCDTDLINKVEFISKSGKTDFIKIDTYAYYALDMVEHVSVHGGDGQWHDVPVHYKEYYPSENEIYASIRYLGLSQSEYKEFYKRLTSESSLIGDYINFIRGYVIIVAPSEDLDKAEEIDKIITRLLKTFPKE